MRKSYRLTAVLWKEGKQYVSKCPQIGVASYGSTPEKALEASKEAVELYISNAKKLGLLDELQPTLRSKLHYTSELEVALV